jgi:hypothetical protein
VTSIRCSSANVNGDKTQIGPHGRRGVTQSPPSVSPVEGVPSAPSPRGAALGVRVAYPVMVIEDEVWTQRIEVALTEVRGWESRTAAEPPDINPQSALGEDDAADPAFPLSSMAWFALQSAVDHLAQLADILTTPGGAPLRPYSPFTLTRSALLAAGQTVWLLMGEDRQERLRRNALVYRDEWVDHLRYLNDYVLDPAIRDSLDSVVVDAINDSVSKLTLKLKRADDRRLGPFSSTKMLDDAARWVRPTPNRRMATSRVPSRMAHRQRGRSRSPVAYELPIGRGHNRPSRQNVRPLACHHVSGNRDLIRRRNPDGPRGLSVVGCAQQVGPTIRKRGARVNSRCDGLSEPAHRGANGVSHCPVLIARKTAMAKKLR